MTYIKVKDAEELVRDSSSSAILNTDNDALNQYKMRKQREAKIDKILQEHEEMKNNLNDIKNLLKELVGQK